MVFWEKCLLSTMWDEGYVDKLKLSSRKKNYGKHNLLINKLKKYIYTIII